jgi:hypothetical protein
MKTLTIQVKDALYDALLEILENLPKHKIKIQETDSDNRLDFEQAMDYALDKNKKLYKRVIEQSGGAMGIFVTNNA